MRSTELMPRMTVPLAVLTFLLSACGDKTKTTDTPALGTTTTTTTTTAPTMAMRDSAASVEIVPPAASTVEAPLVAGRARAPTPAEIEASESGNRRKPTPARRPGSGTGTNATSTPSPTSSPAPERARGTVAAGTSIRVTNGAKLCTSTAQVGDRLTTTTGSVISASNGISIPAGARVGLVVTKSKTSANTGDEALLIFDVRSLTFGGDTYTVNGDVSTDAIVTERKGGDGKKVAIGAAAGAIIGNIIGGGSRVQRTVVGAAAGGLAGAATAAVTGDRFACLPEGAALTVHLTSALTVKN